MLLSGSIHLHWQASSPVVLCQVVKMGEKHLHWAESLFPSPSSRCPSLPFLLPPAPLRSERNTFSVLSLWRRKNAWAVNNSVHFGLVGWKPSLWVEKQNHNTVKENGRHLNLFITANTLHYDGLFPVDQRHPVLKCCFSPHCEQHKHPLNDTVCHVSAHQQHKKMHWAFLLSLKTGS